MSVLYRTLSVVAYVWAWTLTFAGEQARRRMALEEQGLRRDRTRGW